MKTGTRKFWVLLAIGLMLGAIPTSLAIADGTKTLGPPTSSTIAQGTGVIAAGVGPITFNVRTGATVKQVLI